MAGVARRNLVTVSGPRVGMGACTGRLLPGRYNEVVPSSGKSGDIMNSTRNFWPLDYDPEEEIYENPSWDLPGFKPARHSVRSLATRRKPFCKTPHI